MLNTLTLLIGAYVFTRMLEILVRDAGVAGKILLAIFALLTLIIAGLAVWDAVTKLLPLPPLPTTAPRY